MTMITRLSVSDLVSKIAAGELSAVEVVSAFIQRIRDHNDRVNAIVQMDLEAALAQAENQDKARKAGKALGPLSGIPVAVKDGFHAEGFKTTYGARALRHNLATTDSLHVARLKAAGAIVVGKTNMPEFAFGADTDNKLYGRTRNPYALHRTAGSSSGGAGAALALDLVPLADGSDLGGSTRLPAAWCNIVGYRPTAGVVPLVPSPAPFDRLHVVGPLARRVDDIRLAMHVMAGPHGEYPLAYPLGVERFASRLTGDLGAMRIAVCLGGGSFTIDPAVTRALSRCPDALAKAGAHVVEEDPNLAFVAKAQPTFRAICAAEYAGWAVDEYGLELGFDILDLVAQSRKMSGLELERAYQTRVKAWTILQAFFTRYDLMCWPTTAIPPFNPDGLDHDEIDWGTVYVSPMLDLPTVSVPGGFTADGLPVGLQIMGPPGSDRLVLEAAEAIERQLGIWQANPPPVALQAVPA